MFENCVIILISTIDYTKKKKKVVKTILKKNQLINESKQKSPWKNIAATWNSMRPWKIELNDKMK